MILMGTVTLASSSTPATLKEAGTVLRAQLCSSVISFCIKWLSQVKFLLDAPTVPCAKDSTDSVKFT